MRGERASARGAISATPPWRYLVDFSRRRKNRQLQPESVGMDDGLTSTTLGGSTFTLASKYRPQRLVGSGSGGVVVAATCGDTSGEVAIKKIHIERDLTVERHDPPDPERVARGKIDAQAAYVAEGEQADHGSGADSENGECAMPAGHLSTWD